jgi:hypothetical protein
MIVPEENLVHGKLRMLPTADQCQDIASEEHFNNADAAIELYTRMTSYYSYLS